MQRSRSNKLGSDGRMQRAARAGNLTKLWKRAPIAAAIMAAIQGAHAQQADTGLTEVIITAEKRTENLQDVPISVSALDSTKLDQLNVQHFNDYAQALPAVSFQTLQPGFARTFMRGIASDNNPNHSGPLPSVGTYLDEQPITTIQGPLDLHIYDVARVEVLPGPQGTLYGASLEAGTIRIITNKPDTSGFKAGYDIQGNTVKNGTLGAVVEGFVNLPLTSNAALRLVGWYERDSGYIDNVQGTLTYPGIPATDTTPARAPYTLNNAALAKDHYNPTDTYGGRAALKVDLFDTWSITPALIAQETKWHGVFGQEQWKDLADGSAVPNELAVKHFYPEGGQDSWVDAALTVEGKIADFDVTYAGSFLKRTDHTQSDYSDYTLGYQSYASYWPNDQTQLIYGADRYQMFSNEIRVTSPKTWPVRFVAGAFQQRQQHNIEQNYTINGLDPTYWVGVGTPQLWPNTWWLTEQQRVNRDEAIFGEVSWDITSSLTLTGGERHFSYKNTLEGFYGFSQNTFNPGGGPDGSSSGQQICYVAEAFHGAPCEDINKRSDGAGWTPKLNLSYKINSAALVYATWSKGFRPGGVNRVGTAQPYGADFLKNYEVGWKTSWMNNHLRFNGALFYEDWSNFQFSFLGPNSVTIVANAGSAKVKGAETELEWAASPGLTLTAGGAYIDAYLAQNYCGELAPDGNPITTNPCPPTKAGDDPFPPLSPAGTQLPTTPKFKGSLGARYAFPISNDLQGHVQANLVYQTAVWPDLRVNERALLGQQPAYALTNLSFGIDRDSYSLELLVKNVFDRRASLYKYSECTQATCAPIAVYNVVAVPRLIGLQFGQKF